MTAQFNSRCRRLPHDVGAGRGARREGVGGMKQLASVLDVDAHERAIMLGLWTSAYMARKVGWSLQTFLRAVIMAWSDRR